MSTRIMTISNRSNQSCRIVCFTAVIALTILISNAASADTVWFGEAGSNPIPAAGVQISGIDGDSLVFQTSGGATNRKPLSLVQEIAVDGQPALNAAEAAFVAGNWAAAVDGYQQMLTAASKPWIQDRAAARLAVAAEKAGKFDAAVAAYADLVQRKSPLAAAARPAAPTANTPNLAAASSTIEKALANGALNDAGRGMLLGLNLEIARATGDTAKVKDVLGQMSGLSNLDPSTAALVKLGSAQAALDAKDFAKAGSDIQDNAAMFTEPGQQAQALYVIASARDGQLGDAASPDAVKDVALDYMRVVAVGHDLPTAKQQCAGALLHVGRLEEKLKEPKVAAAVYRQLAAEYPNEPAAADASASVARLQAGK